MPDRRLVMLALGVGVLAIGGQVVADLVGRQASSTGELALDAAAVVVPPAVALGPWWARGWRWSRAVTLLAASAGLAVVATGVDSRPSAAAVGAAPVLVLAAAWPRPMVRLPLPWSTVGASALALAVAVGLVAPPREEPAPTGLQLPSGPLDDAQQAIGAADTRFLQDTLGVTEFVPGARCYFVREIDPTGATAAAYAEFVVCGPVLHPAEEPGDGGDLAGAGAWDVYPAQARQGQLVLDDPTLGQEVEPARLSRPDGLRPPSLGEGPTPGVTVDPGYAAQLQDAPDGSRTAGGYLLVGTGRLTVEQVAHPETIVDSGVARGAPDGYRLVAFDLTFEDVEGSSLAVVSGNNQVDVTPVVAEGGELYDDGWVVAVAVDDGVAPILEVAYRGLSQRLSLETGQRLGGHMLLYEPRSLTPGLVVPDVEVPVTVPLPAPHPGELTVDEYRVTRADLTVFDANLAWAPTGQAWVVVSIEGLGNPLLIDLDIILETDIDPGSRFVPSESFTLQPADGEPIRPSAVNPTLAGEMTVVFAVHDLARSFTFRSAPQWRVILGDQELRVTAPTTELALTFG